MQLDRLYIYQKKGIRESNFKSIPFNVHGRACKQFCGIHALMYNCFNFSEMFHFFICTMNIKSLYLFMYIYMYKSVTVDKLILIFPVLYVFAIHYF